MALAASTNPFTLNRAEQVEQSLGVMTCALASARCSCNTYGRNSSSMNYKTVHVQAKCIILFLVK